MSAAARLLPLLLLGLAAPVVGCAQTPQIIDIFPQRGAADVRTNAPITVTFDRPMDRGSVESRFELLELGPHPLLEVPPRPCPQPGAPAQSGSITWNGERQLVFHHPTLATNTEYQAVLLGGYRDSAGAADGLCHYWTFNTEHAPSVSGTSPGAGDRDVNPATYLDLSFSRPMDLPSLRTAISTIPSFGFSLGSSSNDSRTVRLAPDTLLSPGSTYTINIAPSARDVDGNRLAAESSATFTTGSFRPLHGWVTMVGGPEGSGGAGVWVVDATRFPRRLISGSISDFSWSSDGTHLLVGTPTGKWTDLQVGIGSSPLPFTAGWVRRLAGGGYVYLAGSSLKELSAGGITTTIADGVGQAALSPGGRRLLYSVSPPGPPQVTQLFGYDLELRTQYHVATEDGALSGLAWAPNSLRVAYRVSGGVPGADQLHVKDLGPSGGVTRLGAGYLGDPIWAPDSQHLFFEAQVPAAGPRLITKLFRINIASPPGQLTLTQGMPAGDLEPGQVAISADGKQIAFTAGGTTGSQAWLMNSDGSGLLQLTDRGVNDFPYSVLEVGWTPL